MKLIEGIVLRWRLLSICRKLHIRPYEYQRQYAIKGRCKWPDGRQTGKTTAVILWGLIRNVTDPVEVFALARRDPDCWNYLIRREWFYHEYRFRAIMAGIEVPMLTGQEVAKADQKAERMVRGVGRGAQ